MIQSRLAEILSERVMSVHLKEGMRPMVKQGQPGAWELLELIDQEPMSKSDLDVIIAEMHTAVANQSDAFLEQESKHIQVLQVGNMRTVITYPPLSKELEITIVRPVVKLALDDYTLHPDLLERFRTKAEGIFIAGAPGNGKSTFAQALLELYYEQNKIIKTIEVPRDLHVPKGVTQYSLSHSSVNTLRDLLLLTRPDYTFFDEIRNPEDFQLFKDLRLTGIGMVGVVHAERPIDAIQRCIGKIELGMISHVIDTVIFIDQGQIADVYVVQGKVKVPTGLQDDALARPVILVSDFFTGRAVFEIYTFSDQVVVIDIEEAEADVKEGKKRLAGQLEGIRQTLASELSFPFDVEILGSTSISVAMDERDTPGFIGKGGANIRKFEKQLGVHITVAKKAAPSADTLPTIKYAVYQGKRGRTELHLEEPADVVLLYVDGRRQYTLDVPKNGVIRVQKGLLASIVQKGNFKLLKVT